MLPTEQYLEIENKNLTYFVALSYQQNHHPSSVSFPVPVFIFLFPGARIHLPFLVSSFPFPFAI